MVVKNSINTPYCQMSVASVIRTSWPGGKPGGAEGPLSLGYTVRRLRSRQSLYSEGSFRVKGIHSGNLSKLS